MSVVLVYLISFEFFFNLLVCQVVQGHRGGRDDLLELHGFESQGKQTVNCLVNVIFCLRELRNGIDMRTHLILWMRKLIVSCFRPQNIPPDFESKSMAIVGQALVSLKFLSNNYRTIFLEIVLNEIFVEYFQVLVLMSNISHIGDCVENCLCFVLLNCCKLLNDFSPLHPSRELTIREVFSRSNIFSVEVWQSLINRSTMNSRKIILELFDVLFSVQSSNMTNSDTFSCVLSMSPTMIELINSIDWSILAPHCWAGLRPAFVVRGSVSSGAIEFNRDNFLINTANVEAEIEWSSGDVSIIPRQVRDRDNSQKLKPGRLFIPTMSELMVSTILFHLTAAAADPILTFVSGQVVVVDVVLLN